MGPLVLNSDFGVASPYPGQMVLEARKRGWRGEIVHLWHEWPAYRADLGVLLLPRLAGDLPSGAVVVSVVDPGVGADGMCWRYRRMGFGGSPPTTVCSAP